MTPYLKGFHLMIDSWCLDQNAEFWQVKLSLSLTPADLTPPTHVHAVPHLEHDVKALLHLFSSASPPVLFVRSIHIQIAAYGFADALEKVMGAPWETSMSYISAMVYRMSPQCVNHQTIMNSPT
jgi:hypothetical protein